MSKNVLILSASPRKGGNSDSLAEEFAEGAARAGNTVEKLTLPTNSFSSAKAVWYARVHTSVSFTMI